jgi:hypothetical protein
MGTDFAPIQNNYSIGLLPDEWKTTDWPSLLVLCHDYANSVRPQGLKQDTYSDRDGSSHDHSAHHKKVKQWFLWTLLNSRLKWKQNKKKMLENACIT